MCVFLSLIMKRENNTIEENEEYVIRNADDLQGYLRLFFSLVNQLLEFENGKKSEAYISTLQKYYKQSLEKFSENAEYLFFTGYFISLAEWLFGMKDLSISNAMKKKAFALEPQNLLYQWSYEVSIHNKAMALRLADIILGDAKTIEWLKLRGEYGEEVLDAVRCIYRR